MALKIGDKVRFLNSIGGGVVKRFVSKDLVAVEEEDGFETPVMIKECVVIESISTKNAPISSYQKNINQETKNTYSPAPKIVETKDGDKLNLILAFLPLDEKNIQTTDYESFLVNNSNYFVQYNYLCKQGKGWILRNTGIIEPNQQIFLEEISKDKLNELERICVQFTAHKKDKNFELKSPGSVEIHLDTVKFYKLHSFQENNYFEDNAMIYFIVKNDQQQQMFEIKPEEIEWAMKSKGDLKTPVKQSVNINLGSSILEIDLHANELIDSTVGLVNSDIIRIQLDKFNEIMKENLRIKGKKIVFIHGKGEGVLRKAILDELKIKYKSCQYQDASFREYGFGATMITIK
ncbi:MAG: DUF2027 domain-containing protein [Bacteroidales bacterium]|nr:DUF2027 domain-containing protein [Bacteroidales bacterium]